MGTDESNQPERRPAAVTVLPVFGKRLEVPAVADAPSAEPASQEPVGKLPRVALLRRKTTAHPPVIVDASAAPVAPVPPAPAAPLPLAVVEPSAPAGVPVDVPALVPQQGPPSGAPELSDAVVELQAALARALERAGSAEAANAVLRRKLAQLDDELAQFRPRAAVPFEDNVN